MAHYKPIKPRTGIVGIERNIEERNRATGETISEAFQDLKILMNKASEMVTLSKSIANKIREKQGEITEDETVQLKAHLLSLGLDDPVTREGSKSSNKYYAALAEQVSDFILTYVQQSYGQLALPDVYCRVNRARGMDLISPDDLLRTCQLMESLNKPLRLRKLASGVLVLQDISTDEETLASEAASQVPKSGNFAPADLAQLWEVPIALAQERLQLAEKFGLVVRDDSSSGVMYFPNLFLTPAAI